MPYTVLELVRTGKTCVLRIQRPEVLNALSRTVLQELSDALDELEDDASVQGIILTGAGDKAFVAGADISEIKALSPSQVAAFSTYGQQLFARIEQFAKPIVALVNGFALGGGCELSMACHLRVATPKAKFGQPEVNLGIIAGYGGTQRLPRLIGKTKAMELLLTGDMIKAEEAERLGLVNAVKPEEEAMDYALALLGFPLHALYRPLDLKPLDQYVRSSRSRSGLVLVDKFGKVDYEGDPNHLSFEGRIA